MLWQLINAKNIAALIKSTDSHYGETGWNVFEIRHDTKCDHRSNLMHIVNGTNAKTKIFPHSIISCDFILMQTACVSSTHENGLCRCYQTT